MANSDSSSTTPKVRQSPTARILRVDSDSPFRDANRYTRPTRSCSARHLGQTAADVSLRSKAESLHAARDKLLKVDRHDALSLLRVSLGHPKVIYALRAGACFGCPGLTVYDAELRETAIGLPERRPGRKNLGTGYSPPQEGRRRSVIRLCPRAPFVSCFV